MATEEAHWDRQALERYQCGRLEMLLQEILPSNAFYEAKLAEGGFKRPIRSLSDVSDLPFTDKAEIINDQQAHPPYGTFLTFSQERYTRLHQTSGTTAQPLRWLDTKASWEWMLGCWEKCFEITGINNRDRLFFPFSFGPFLGFWTAFEAATRLGMFCLPGGGMSSGARLRVLLDNEISVVLCTPTYALRLAEVAFREGIDLENSSVRTVIVAGEPGGSVGAIRARMERAWGARVFDHCGMTEIGPSGIECPENPSGIHLLESEYLVEVIDPNTLHPVAPGRTGELVLTNLGRFGSPLIRYRTGDLVVIDARPCPCGRTLVRLDKGILGRTDDMISIRGNNLYPSALDAIVTRFPEVDEYQVEVDETNVMPVVRVELEPISTESAHTLADRVGRAIHEELLFRAEVRAVAAGSLPRFEMKARRFHRKKRE